MNKFDKVKNDWINARNKIAGLFAVIAFAFFVLDYSIIEGWLFFLLFAIYFRLSKIAGV